MELQAEHLCKSYSKKRKLSVTILLKNILAGASVIALFLVMLVIFNQDKNTG